VQCNFKKGSRLEYSTKRFQVNRLKMRDDKKEVDASSITPKGERSCVPPDCTDIWKSEITDLTTLERKDLFGSYIRSV
jgi:hypothetical protein